MTRVLPISAVALALVGEVHLGDDAGILDWLVSREVSDQARVGVRASETVDDEGAPASSRQADDLACRAGAMVGVKAQAGRDTLRACAQRGLLAGSGNVPSPFPKSTLTVPQPAAARSALPSPLKSSATTRPGRFCY